MSIAVGVWGEAPFPIVFVCYGWCTTDVMDLEWCHATETGLTCPKQARWRQS